MRTLLILALAAGCTFDEELPIHDLRGTVVLPQEAAMRTFEAEDGTEYTLEDVRLIGPVVLGVYPSVRTGLFEYTHPEIGPVFQTSIAGDTYPYGGTTVGDVRFGCIEELSCKLTSGRFVDYDAIVEWFNEIIDQPLSDQFNDPVETGAYLQQICYETGNFTQDDEVRITATQDKNGDEKLDALDLDFVQRNDGKWEAEFVLWQQEYFEREDCEGEGCGFTLWGWMDAPSSGSYQFSTCDPQNGREQNDYASSFEGGRQYRDLLNFPSQYISSGDWVATEGYIYSSPFDDNVILEIDDLVEN